MPCDLFACMPVIFSSDKDQSIMRLLNSCPRLTHLSLTGVAAFQRDDFQAYCRVAPAGKCTEFGFGRLPFSSILILTCWKQNLLSTNATSFVSFLAVWSPSSVSSSTPQRNSQSSGKACRTEPGAVGSGVRLLDVHKLWPTISTPLKVKALTMKCLMKRMTLRASKEPTWQLTQRPRIHHTFLLRLRLPRHRSQYRRRRRQHLESCSILLLRLVMLTRRFRVWNSNTRL